MRTLSRAATTAITVITLATSAHAQQVTQLDAQPIVVPSQSSVFNQNGVNLPSAPSVHGQDRVNGASGMSCESAIASGGPYVDLGVIGAQDVYARDTAAVYGRIVVPLGKRPKRVDCTKLYELEITRLKMELELMRLGTTGGSIPTASAAPSIVQQR